MGSGVTTQEELIPLSIAVSVLSILGSLFMMGCYLFVSELNKTPIFAFIANLALADLLLTIDGLPNLIYPETTLVDGTLCSILGGIRQLNYASSYLWAFSFGQIMWNFYKGEYQNQKDIKTHYPRIRLIIWSLSILSAAIPYIFNAYGPSLLFCWLSESIHGTEYILLTGFLGYLPGFVLGFLLIYYYARILRAVMKSKKSEEDRPDTLEIILYPSIFLFTMIFVIVDRVFLVDYENNWIIVSTHILLRQGQGLLNCIAYGMNKQVKKAIKRSFSKEELSKTKNVSLPNMKSWDPPSNRASLFSDVSRTSNEL